MVAWTAESELAFEKVKKAVDECPRLNFNDRKSEIKLQTDACNKGIGAYLFQEKDGKEYPVAFLTKAFDERMSKGSTFHQEGFAIY